MFNDLHQLVGNWLSSSSWLLMTSLHSPPPLASGGSSNLRLICNKHSVQSPDRMLVRTSGLWCSLSCSCRLKLASWSSEGNGGPPVAINSNKHWGVVGGGQDAVLLHLQKLIKLISRLQSRHLLSSQPAVCSLLLLSITELTKLEVIPI